MKRVTGTTEARSLVALVVALFALAVPAAASITAGSATPAVDSDSAPQVRAGLGLIDNAPPQALIIMVVGIAIVGLTVRRRMRKSGLGPGANRT